MIQRLLIITCLIAGFSLSSWSQNLAGTGATLLSSNPKDCQPIKFYVSWTTGCANWTFNNFSYTASGSTFTIRINYTGSQICLPIFNTHNDTATFTNVPVGNYTNLVLQCYDGTTLLHTLALNGSMNVTSCCPISSIITGDTASYCIGDTVSLTSADTSISKPYWFKNGTLVDSSRNYKYVVTSAVRDSISLTVDTTTCSDTSFTFINTLADPILPNDTVVCLNDLHRVTATGNWPKWQWSNGRTSPSFTSFNTNTYVVTVTAHSGCTRTDSVRVEHRGPQFSLGNDTSFCTGSSVTLSIDTSWISPKWLYINKTGYTLVVDSAATYVAEVQNDIGCVFQDAITVTEIDTFMRVYGGDSACIGDQVQVYISRGKTNVLWSTGSTDDTITVSQAGFYSVSANGTAGCPLSGNQTVGFHSLPLVELGNDTTICEGDTLSVSAGDNSRTYIWSTGETTPDVLVVDSTLLNVMVTDMNGCMASDTIKVFTMDCDTTPSDTSDTTVSIICYQHQLEYNIYPVPSNDILFVESYREQGIERIQIVNMKGEIVLEAIVQSHRAELDIKPLSSGNYILSTEFSSGFIDRKKIIIE